MKQAWARSESLIWNELSLVFFLSLRLLRCCRNEGEDEKEHPLEWRVNNTYFTQKTTEILNAYNMQQTEKSFHGYLRDGVAWKTPLYEKRLIRIYLNVYLCLYHLFLYPIISRYICVHMCIYISSYVYIYISHLPYLFFNLLEYSGLRMCLFQVYSKINQVYKYIYPFLFRFFSHAAY